MTKLFTLLYNDEVHLAPGKKVLSADDYTALLSADELGKTMQDELEKKRKEDASAAALAEQEAIDRGFQDGLNQWTQQLAQFEKTLQTLKTETEKNIVPVAIKAAQKIVGHELEQKPEIFIDIVKQSLKAVSQHRRFSFYVNPQDLALFEQQRGNLKQVIEHAESLTITPREEVPAGQCTIETEAGIINVNLEELWKALEAAFQHLMGS